MLNNNVFGYRIILLPDRILPLSLSTILDDQKLAIKFYKNQKEINRLKQETKLLKQHLQKYDQFNWEEEIKGNNFQCKVINLLLQDYLTSETNLAKVKPYSARYYLQHFYNLAIYLAVSKRFYIWGYKSTPQLQKIYWEKYCNIAFDDLKLISGQENLYISKKVFDSKNKKREINKHEPLSYLIEKSSDSVKTKTFLETLVDYLADYIKDRFDALYNAGREYLLTYLVKEAKSTVNKHPEKVKFAIDSLQKSATKNECKKYIIPTNWQDTDSFEKVISECIKLYEYSQKIDQKRGEEKNKKNIYRHEREKLSQLLIKTYQTAFTNYQQKYPKSDFNDFLQQIKYLYQSYKKRHYLLIEKSLISLEQTVNNNNQEDGIIIKDLLGNNVDNDLQESGKNDVKIKDILTVISDYVDNIFLQKSNSENTKVPCLSFGFGFNDTQIATLSKLTRQQIKREKDNFINDIVTKIKEHYSDLHLTKEVKEKIEKIIQPIFLKFIYDQFLIYTNGNFEESYFYLKFLESYLGVHCQEINQQEQKSRKKIYDNLQKTYNNLEIIHKQL